MKQGELHGRSIIERDYTVKEGSSFFAFNPVEYRNLLPPFYEVSRKDLMRAVSSSEAAFPLFSRVSGKGKAGFLDTIAEKLEDLKEKLIPRCMQETGLPEVRLEGELKRTAGQLRMFARLVEEGSWVDARIDTKGNDIRSMLFPVGPVAVFGASNFPLAFSTAGGDTVSALAAGCPVVFKGHPAHPGTCELAAEAVIAAAEETGMPLGVFSLLQGREHQLGIDLVSRPEIKAVAFTGSFPAGKALFDAIGKREEPIPFFGEMGSVNPVVLLPQALLRRGDEIAEELAGSMTLGVGQFCTNPGLVFLAGDESLVTRFRERLIDALRSVPPGTMLNKNIWNAFINGIDTVSSLDGVEVEWAGSGTGSGKKLTAAGCVVSASLDAFLSNAALRQEIFGPVTVVVQTKSEKELLTVLKTIGGQLTITFHHQDDDLKHFRQVVETAKQRAGRVIFNGFPTGVEVCSAMNHGGPYPASTDVRSTSVGTRAILRFARPVCFQNAPEEMLPDELKDGNPLGIRRLINGVYNKYLL